MIPSRPHSGAGLIVLTWRTVAVKSPVVVCVPVLFHSIAPLSVLPQKSSPPAVIAIVPPVTV